MQRPLLILAFSASLVACDSDRIYDCTIGQSVECQRDGQQGDCLAPGFCAFSDSSCGTGLRWDSTARDDLAGQCVDPNGGGDGGALGLCDGTGLEQNITGEGSVSASSVYSGFQPSLSVDGDLGTSWFSAGSDTDGTESVFSWLNNQDRCIEVVSITGNEFHPMFPQNFGFGQVTVEVRNEFDVVVFSKIEPLPGTPDQAQTVNTGGVIGRSVHLKLQGHESSDCGGFAELVINAKL